MFYNNKYTNFLIFLDSSIQFNYVLLEKWASTNYSALYIYKNKLILRKLLSEIFNQKNSAENVIYNF